MGQARMMSIPFQLRAHIRYRHSVCTEGMIMTVREVLEPDIENERFREL